MKADYKKTKLIMVSHMINITGQILPVKKICEMAHSYGLMYWLMEHIVLDT